MGVPSVSTPLKATEELVNVFAYSRRVQRVVPITISPLFPRKLIEEVKDIGGFLLPGRLSAW